MALAGVLAGTAQGDAVVDRAVVADLRRLTKDDAHAVVDKELAPDLGAGVDLDAGQVARQLADKTGQEETPVVVQKMCDLVRDQHMKAGVQDDDLRHIARGRVLIADIFCIFPKAHSSFLFPFTILIINIPQSRTKCNAVRAARGFLRILSNPPKVSTKIYKILTFAKSPFALTPPSLHGTISKT